MRASPTRRPRCPRLGEVGLNEAVVRPEQVRLAIVPVVDPDGAGPGYVVHHIVDRAFGILPNPCALGDPVEHPERVGLGGPLVIERVRTVHMPLWVRVKASRPNGRLFPLTRGGGVRRKSQSEP